MQVEAIYENGKVRFVTPIRLKKHAIRMQVTIPDDEIEHGQEGRSQPERPQAAPAAGAFTDELKIIMAPVAEQLKSAENRPLSKAEIRETLGAAWEEKHSG